MASTKSWNTEDKDFLVKNYPIKGALFCAEKLGRGVRGVRIKARRMKLIAPKVKEIYLEDNLRPIITKAKTLSDALRALGLKTYGGNPTTLKNYIKLYGIDISHFTSQSDRMYIMLAAKKLKQVPLSELLVENNFKSGTTGVKERLYKDGIKKRNCELCGQGEMWHGKKMSLILDHINGIRSDFRLKNLQIVCPNCNATLDTYCRGTKPNRAKKIKKKRKKAIRLKQRRSERPPLEQIVIEVNKSGYVAIGKKYGVSGNAIKKWIRADEKMEGKEIRGRKKKISLPHQQLNLL